MNVRSWPPGLSAEATPTTLPARLHNGPLEPPRLTAALVWIRCASASLTVIAPGSVLTMLAVAVTPAPKGLPSEAIHSPKR